MFHCTVASIIFDGVNFLELTEMVMLVNI